MAFVIETEKKIEGFKATTILAYMSNGQNFDDCLALTSLLERYKHEFKSNYSRQDEIFCRGT